jgi:branched-subunit amino acid aminotransferase/4-amino-4-deoxychorismate lyase
MLFFNERGELTERRQSNVFVNVDGHWWTPPVSSGLLPGVTRSVVLDDPARSSAERVLTRKDLARARRRFHGLQRVARSIESENRKPMNQDSALLNYPSSNPPSLGIYVHNRSGPPNEDFGRPYSGPRRVL